MEWSYLDFCQKDAKEFNAQVALEVRQRANKMETKLIVGPVLLEEGHHESTGKCIT